MPKKILIIDDDPTMVKMVESFLAAHGYTVLSASGGEEGLEQIRAGRPDLIILDIQMPAMNGYTFIFEFKKIPDTSAIPVIVLTAKDGMAEIFKVEGVKEYLTKPFQPEVLLAKIKKYL
ncbi:MAG: response regulator transcription factor [Candidatus Omnitrophica bacterium]|nr:response regulator transcription factor [Candidatus Omnitrophota bacterium]